MSKISLDESGWNGVGGGGGGTFTTKRNLSANLVVTERTQNLGFSERAHNKDRLDVIQA